jgi:hypothetical protein
MSYRGSFITQYIYCQRDRDIMIEALAALSRNGVTKVGECDAVLAGITHGMHRSEERFDFDALAHTNLKLCHAVRLAVMPEEGGIVCYTLQPDVAREAEYDAERADEVRTEMAKPCSAEDPVDAALPGRHKALRYVAMPYGKSTMDEVALMAKEGIATGKACSFYRCEDCGGIFCGYARDTDGRALAIYGRRHWSEYIAAGADW